MKQPRIITIDEVTAAQGGRVAALWNVLTEDYFTGELIPGSRHVPLDRVGREILASGLPKNAPIMVYCSGPGCPHSKSAGEKLAALGYSNVGVFEGGLEVWKAAGRPLEQAMKSVDA